MDFTVDPGGLGIPSSAAGNILISIGIGTSVKQECNNTPIEKATIKRRKERI